ncbi:torsin-4A [Carcharodon carcharias]|uniref:torsin-4A n=1 Tax=Carcharodon carcharias TaxID=13397 RepID=UPI001B7E8970|nr:torsin-4A [Carcharodon carcharias]XP_041048731.1 torsin-4A [Carcharodon carcharias]XP_041048732.1 torsin-4A [Carcharodon carcharias]XP_041048733.1 torsin-4A [Carcharodon carcharias]XP_041048734.1 torsin-4A [Carcharodon carcharias]XP_041048736.1 torsin-4A [Carcharodon carcharias]XP_041048737.1 torsin-4A [Carcharodon carcharias]XP_041048738.1 torsin-4A [Carcharodon carcharias]XP_041048739.1 torsin-4A [Carcharodon carcharias]
MEPVRKALPVARQQISTVTSPLRAAHRIRHKYLIMKRRHISTEHSEPTGAEGPGSRGTGRYPSSKGQEPSERTSKYRTKTAEYFTFEKVPVKTMKKRRSSKRRKVLYPSDTKRYLPEEKKSKAKNCLFLLSLIVFFQIYNAIENLDDNVLKYDLTGLEKMLKREVFGQLVAIDSLMDLLNDYLATHIHNKPLVLSLNGPIGVGKSLVGRLLAKHFRSVLSDHLVYQYFVLHHCPGEDNVTSCLQELAGNITDTVSRAEAEEKIPLLIFDEVEFMQPALLDFLQSYFHPNQPNEFLNAVYVLISSYGQGEITKFVLQNASSGMMRQTAKSEELLFIVQSLLTHSHPIWKHADIVPFTLLERTHIENCFLEQMMREGFYPDNGQLDELSRELNYYSVGKHQYSVHGCKYVGSKVNLLH